MCTYMFTYYPQTDSILCISKVLTYTLTYIHIYEQTFICTYMNANVYTCIYSSRCIHRHTYKLFLHIL